jgi:four helix bundle protein
MEREDALKIKSKKLALESIRLFAEMPRTRAAYVIGDQFLRSGTSAGANYREACKARSQADFISKMGIVESEADEAKYWMELMAESGLIEKSKIESTYGLASEVTAMAVASIRTARKRKDVKRG